MNKRFFRLIFGRTFRCLGIALVISLIAGTLLGGGYYTVSALCACGFVLIAWGWFIHLKNTGMHTFGKFLSKQKRRIPWLHQRFKAQRSHRPAFRMDSADFDDDLTSQTMVNDEEFDEKQQLTALAVSYAACGVLLVIFSFFI